MEGSFVCTSQERVSLACSQWAETTTGMCPGRLRAVISRLTALMCGVGQYYNCKMFGISLRVLRPKSLKNIIYFCRTTLSETYAISQPSVRFQFCFFHHVANILGYLPMKVPCFCVSWYRHNYKLRIANPMK